MNVQWFSSSSEQQMSHSDHVQYETHTTVLPKDTLIKIGHMYNGGLSWKRFLILVAQLVQGNLRHKYFQDVLKQQVCSPESWTIPRWLLVKQATPCGSLSRLWFLHSVKQPKGPPTRTWPCHSQRSMLKALKHMTFEARQYQQRLVETQEKAFSGLFFMAWKNYEWHQVSWG